MREIEFYEKWIPEKLTEKCQELGIDISDVEYRFKIKKDELDWEEITFTGWSKDWVFVIRHYDGWERIVAIPRNPVSEDNLSKRIGGG